MGNNGRSPTGRHILAINNDQAVLGLFRALLEEEGYRVSTQAYIEKDLKEIERLEPDLIILDYMWAEEDSGWSTLQMLRMSPKLGGIPVVLCTGAVREVEALSGHLLEMGVRVVLKPFSIYRLLDVITEALEQTQSDAKLTERPE